MNHLGRDARLIIEDGRDAHEPTAADRVRVTELLANRMGAAILGTSSAAFASSGVAVRRSIPALWKVVGIAGIVAVGGALYVQSRKPIAVRTGEKPAVLQVSPISAAPPLAAIASAPVLEAAATSASAALLRVEPAPRTTRPRSDSLGDEVALLTLAGKELHSGKPEAALRTLEEHQRRFPSGALAVERSAARIQALCALGRTSQAATESAKLSRTSPQGVLATQACASK